MERTEEKNLLFKTILSLKSLDDCYDFFDDLCTICAKDGFSKSP